MVQFAFQYVFAKVFPVVLGVEQVHMPYLVDNGWGRSAPGQYAAEVYKLFILCNGFDSKSLRPLLLLCQFFRKGERDARLIGAEVVDPLPERFVGGYPGIGT